MCDVVYVLMLDRVERRTTALIAGLVAGGAVSVSDAAELIDSACAGFTAALNGPPVPESENTILLRELGVA